jgi:hypothetical protein
MALCFVFSGAILQDGTESENETDEESMSSTNGVYWKEDHWDVEDDCSSSIIPLEETSICSEWKKSRMTDIVTDCIPKELCASCGISLEMGELRAAGSISVHTMSGTHRRNIFESICCGVTNQWSPSSECLHSVLHNQHASEFYHVLVTVNENCIDLFIYF